MQTKLTSAGLLPLRKQAELSSEILQERLEKVLPWAMERSGIDFWVIIGKEYCEDPVMKTLLTWDIPYAHRVTVLMYHYNRETKKVRAMAGGSQSEELNRFYENIQQENETVWQSIARIIEEISPQQIGVNISDQYTFADGLTATELRRLKNCLTSEMAQRICSAEDLVVRWLQITTPKELCALKAMAEVTQDIIRAVFSNESIVPGITTTTDLEWQMRELIDQLGFDYWFGPDIDLQRRNDARNRIYHTVILPGDILHCDIGMEGRYAALNTDMQWIAYVRLPGEEEVPQGIEELFRKGNRFRDIVCSYYKEGVSGNDLFCSAMKQGEQEGLFPSLYTHPIGTFGHGAGPIIGLYTRQEPIEVRGERPIENETCYALELNVCGLLPEWDNQCVTMYLEEDIYFNQGVSYIYGRQTKVLKV